MATYSSKIFETTDLVEAKGVILTPTGNLGTEARWEIETPYLAELLGNALGLKAGQLLVDYGCGAGRLSRALIERFGCTVLGVDISQSMRGLAPAYVDNPAFSVVSRMMLQTMVRGGLRIDAAISVWVLQHCLAPREDIDLMRQALKEGGRLGVVNMRARAVPTEANGWVNDGTDVAALLAARLTPVETGQLAQTSVGPTIAEHTFWGVYRRD
jgi:cyclopropane fatty-acyl-phospholipid synthase-like methyltransferase